MIHQDAVQITYALSSAAEDTSLATMAWRKAHRYLIERSNQDVKGELGWDEFHTRKFRVWEHQLAMTILAAWIVAETRLKKAKCKPDGHCSGFLPSWLSSFAKNTQFFLGSGQNAIF